MEIIKYKKTTSSTLINNLHKLLAKFDIRHVIVSDNETQYMTCKTFSKNCEMVVVEHITAASYSTKANR